MEQLQYNGSIEIFSTPSDTKKDAIPLPSLQPSFACAMQRSLAYIEKARWRTFSFGHWLRAQVGHWLGSMKGKRHSGDCPRRRLRFLFA